MCEQHIARVTDPLRSSANGPVVCLKQPIVIYRDCRGVCCSSGASFWKGIYCPRIVRIVTFSDQMLRQITGGTRQITTQMSQLAFRRIADHLHVSFEQLQPQQPVVIRRLVVRPNSEPAVIGIEWWPHFRAMAFQGRRFLAMRVSDDLGRPSYLGFWTDTSAALAFNSARSIVGASSQ